MKSKVYFTPVSDSADIGAVTGKLKNLLDRSSVLDVVRENYNVAVKIHFGEKGNTGYVRPVYARVVCEAIRAKGADPTLADTNTLYRGERINSEKHLEIAREHGFTSTSTCARIVIPDDSVKKNTTAVKIDGKFIKLAKIASFFVDADAIVAINHFKGHILTGFGGALKNIGMGCATREGKLAQHCDISPVVQKDECIGCGECLKVCPAGAIRIENNKSIVDRSKCIGCASCIAACPTSAMFIDMDSGGAVQQKMVEYAAAILRQKKSKSAFLNFAVRINKECDCWSEETPRLAPDVGIFASLDPVSTDKASYDMVLKSCSRDVFKEAHPGQDGSIHLKYAQDLGLGNLDYELIEV